MGLNILKVVTPICAFVPWKYDASYLSQAGIAAALDSVATVARGRTGGSCVMPLSAIRKRVQALSACTLLRCPSNRHAPLEAGPAPQRVCWSSLVTASRTAAGCSSWMYWPDP